MGVPPFAFGDCFAALVGTGKRLQAIAGSSSVLAIFYCVKNRTRLPVPTGSGARAAAPIGLSKRHDCFAIHLSLVYPTAPPPGCRQTVCITKVLQTFGIHKRHELLRNSVFRLFTTKASVRRWLTSHCPAMRRRAAAPIGLSKRHDAQAHPSFAWLPDGSPECKGLHPPSAHVPPCLVLRTGRLRDPSCGERFVIRLRDVVAAPSDVAKDRYGGTWN